MENQKNAGNSNDEHFKKLWKVEDVAARLSLQPFTIRAMARAGRLPCIQDGRLRRFDPDAIEKWITGHARPARG